MFIPYGTDTPIYYWPIATGCLIVANVVCYPLMLEHPSTYGLLHGDGLHPLQWFTSFFAHGNLLHLIGNMLFLFVFGAIVEGKTGPLKFTTLYLTVGVFQNIIEQLLYLGTPEAPSLGASSAIYGMLMCCMLFAPKDNILVLFVFFFMFIFRPFFIRVPILVFAIFYFLWDFTIAFFTGFPMGTALLHVMGALVGLAAGALMLRLRWVDCDNEDLVSLFRDAFGLDPHEKKLSKRQLAEVEEQQQVAEIESQRRLEVAWKSIDTHIAVGNINAALAVYGQLHRRDPSQRWDETRLLHVIRFLMEQKDWQRVVECSYEYLEHFHARESMIRINLAKIQLLENHSPRRALKELQAVDLEQLTAKQRHTIKQITLKARQEINEGAIELGED